MATCSGSVGSANRAIPEPSTGNRGVHASSRQPRHPVERERPASHSTALQTRPTTTTATYAVVSSAGSTTAPTQAAPATAAVASSAHLSLSTRRESASSRCVSSRPGPVVTRSGGAAPREKAFRARDTHGLAGRACTECLLGPSTGRRRVHRCPASRRSQRRRTHGRGMDGIPLGASYTRKEARSRGVTRGQIALDGLPIARGLYVSRAFPPTLAVRCRAWTRLLPPDAAFGLETAAALLGAALPPPPAVQIVLRPRPVLPRRAGLQVHVRDLREDDVVEVTGLRVTSGAQTFLDLAARLPPAELVAVGDALMRGEHLTAHQVAARLARADGVRGVVS